MPWRQKESVKRKKTVPVNFCSCCVEKENVERWNMVQRFLTGVDRQIEDCVNFCSSFVEKQSVARWNMVLRCVTEGLEIYMKTLPV